MIKDMEDAVNNQKSKEKAKIKEDEKALIKR